MSNLYLSKKSISTSEQPQLLPSPSISKNLSNQGVKNNLSKVEGNVGSPKSPLIQERSIKASGRLKTEAILDGNPMDKKTEIIPNKDFLGNLQEILGKIKSTNFDGGTNSFKTIADNLVEELNSLEQPHSIDTLAKKYNNIAQQAGELRTIADSTSTLRYCESKKSIATIAQKISDDIHSKLKIKLGSENKLEGGYSKEQLVIGLMQARGSLGIKHGKKSEFKEKADAFMDQLKEFDPNESESTQLAKFKTLHTQFKSFAKLGYEGGSINRIWTGRNHHVTDEKRDFYNRSLQTLSEIQKHIGLKINKQIETDFESSKSMRNLDEMLVCVERLTKLEQIHRELKSINVGNRDSVQQIYDKSSGALNNAKVLYQDVIKNDWPTSSVSNKSNNEEIICNGGSTLPVSNKPDNKEENHLAPRVSPVSDFNQNDYTGDKVKWMEPPIEVRRGRYEPTDEDENESKLHQPKETTDFLIFGEPTLNSSISLSDNQVLVKGGETVYSKVDLMRKSHVDNEKGQISMSDLALSEGDQEGIKGLIEENEELDIIMEEIARDPVDFMYPESLSTRISFLVLCDELLSDVAIRNNDLTRKDLVDNLKPLVLVYLNVKDRFSLIETPKDFEKIDNLRRYVLNKESIESENANKKREDSDKTIEKVTQDQVVEILFGSKVKNLKEIVSTRTKYIDALNNSKGPEDYEGFKNFVGLGLFGDVLNQFKSLEKKQYNDIDLSDESSENGYKDDESDTDISSRNSKGE